jgi:hypothetical protein
VGYSIGSANTGSISYSDEISAAARNEANNTNKRLDAGTKNRAYAISSDVGLTFSATTTAYYSMLRLLATDGRNW